jgi:excisionase family DNA binding protein
MATTPAPDPRDELIAGIEMASRALVQILRDQQEAASAAKPVRKALTVREAAEISGDSPRAIAEWCQKGTIKAEKHGARWRIPAAELERFLSKSRRRGGLRAVEQA